MARYFLITTVIGMFLLVSLLLAALFHLPAGEVSALNGDQSVCRSPTLAAITSAIPDPADVAPCQVSSGSSLSRAA